MVFILRYLNSSHIQKEKLSDADLAYGSLQVEVSEQLVEIGEYNLLTSKQWYHHI